MKSSYLQSFLENAPTSWAIIRACEAEILNKVKFRGPILEIGCGDGLFSHLCFKNKMVIDVAIDIDEREIERARKCNLYNQLYVMDVRNMNFRKASFNNVFSNGVLEHITNIHQVLREINRVLTINGNLVLTCPTNNLTTNLFFYNLLKIFKLKYLAEIYGKFFNKIFGHQNLYSKKEWKNLLVKSGFKIVKYQPYGCRTVVWIHELLLPLALTSLISKRYINRLVLLRNLRTKFFIPLWLPVLQKTHCHSKTRSCNSSVLIIAKKI